MIGIVYVVSASLGVIALDRAPQGAEHIKQLLIGSILTVTPQEVATLAALYALIGVVHFAVRRPLIEVSFDPQLAASHGRRLFIWDVVFYASFALVVTSSVRVAGVLLVFAYLIVPAALANLFIRDVGQRLLLAWGLGVALTAAGLYASWRWDLPTGPADCQRVRCRDGAGRPGFRTEATFPSQHQQGTARGNCRGGPAASRIPENGSALARRNREHRAACSDGFSNRVRTYNAQRQHRIGRAQSG